MQNRLQTRALLQVNPGGYGFARPIGSEEARSVFIPPGQLRGALDGDELEVVYWESEKGLEGRIESIVARKRTRVVGVLAGARRSFVIEADDPRLIWPIQVVDGPGTGTVGKVVVATIVEYPSDPDPAIFVKVQRTLGEAGALETEIQRILIEHEIANTFPDAVLDEARGVETEVQAEDRVNRADLRSLPFMTIDPPDARDFDDAVCVEALPGEFVRLHVAVADVSHYVREGTAIDAEAVERSFSCYLPDRAIPMLPEQLSSHMCSLVPEQDRLAMVVSMRVGPSGEVDEYQVRAAIIHSRKRLTYDEVARELDGADKLEAEVRARVFALRACSDHLRAARLRRGAIELDLAEAKVVLEDDDRTRIRTVIKSRSSKSMARAYNLIEELMIAANEAVGELAVAHQLPVVFRVHDKPNEEKLEQLATAALELGSKADPEKLLQPRGVQKFLSKLTGKRFAPALNMLMLRAMAQAHYSTENVGHFALASNAYVHFTSPIRRYPDLISHRVMKAWVARQGGDSGPADKLPRMPKANESQVQAELASEREREVSGAERETQNLFAAIHMRDRIGDRFEGTITGISQFGVFVQLDEPFVDGMIRIADLERERRDSFARDDAGIRLIGSRTGFTLSVGDRVIIEVVDASIPRRQIDMVFISALSG